MTDRWAVVWKFEVPDPAEFELELPDFSRPLSCQMQNGKPVLWVVLDPEAPRFKRKFLVVPTGYPFPIDWTNDMHVSTWQGADGFVWHLFAR